MRWPPHVVVGPGGERVDLDAGRTRGRARPRRRRRALGGLVAPDRGDPGVPSGELGAQRPELARARSSDRGRGSTARARRGGLLLDGLARPDRADRHAVAVLEPAPERVGLGEQEAGVEREQVDRQRVARDQIDQHAALGAEAGRERQPGREGGAAHSRISSAGRPSSASAAVPGRSRPGRARSVTSGTSVWAPSGDGNGDRRRKKRWSSQRVDDRGHGDQLVGEGGWRQAELGQRRGPARTPPGRRRSSVHTRRNVSARRRRISQCAERGSRAATPGAIHGSSPALSRCQEAERRVGDQGQRRLDRARDRERDLEVVAGQALVVPEQGQRRPRRSWSGRRAGRRPRRAGPRAVARARSASAGRTPGAGSAAGARRTRRSGRPTGGTRRGARADDHAWHQARGPAARVRPATRRTSRRCHHSAYRLIATSTMTSAGLSDPARDHEQRDRHGDRRVAVPSAPLTVAAPALARARTIGGGLGHRAPSRPALGGHPLSRMKV